MTPAHHPSEETLARYAAGTLAAGPRVVVATHLLGCPACQAHVADLEAVGGALLEAIEPSPLAPEALARTLAMIDAPAPAAAPAAASAKKLPDLPEGFALPAPLLECEIGRWRSLGPGIRWSRLRVPADPKANVMMLRVAAGKELPEHGHTGTEYTQVLFGSYSDGQGRYQPGDLLEADADMEHQPIVDPDGECICLAAIEGRMRLHSFVGRLLQPLIGF